MKGRLVSRAVGLGPLVVGCRFDISDGNSLVRGWSGADSASAATVGPLMQGTANTTGEGGNDACTCDCVGRRNGRRYTSRIGGDAVERFTGAAAGRQEYGLHDARRPARRAGIDDRAVRN